MNTLNAKFISSITRTKSVTSFRFLAPESLSFLPGQFVKVFFNPRQPSDKALNKYLSFSSSPGKSYFEVTKRLSSSDFSQALLGLKFQDEVTFSQGLGKCVFKKDYQKITFLIGGIGITPVVSIIEFVSRNKLDNDIELFYSNRSEDDIAFKDELDSWPGENIRVFYLVTDCQGANKNCIYSRIDKEVILKYSKGLADRMVFIFGPPTMVRGLSALCQEQLMIKQDKILTEEFTGY